MSSSIRSNEVTKLNEIELKFGATGDESWHRTFSDSSYIFIGGLDTRLTEGDIITVFSQWGQPIDMHLVRDDNTGESKGFGFLCYEDQQSTILAVDNANGMSLIGKALKVNHHRFRPPRDPNLPSDAQVEYKPSGPDGKGLNIVSKTFVSNITRR